MQLSEAGKRIINMAKEILIMRMTCGTGLPVTHWKKVQAPGIDKDSKTARKAERIKIVPLNFLRFFYFLEQARKIRGGRIMKPYLMTAPEMVNEFGISRGYAYKLIQQMNEQLKAEGYATIRGKIPRAYVEKHFYGYHSTVKD